jgi:hypothetical protein
MGFSCWRAKDATTCGLFRIAAKEDSDGIDLKLADWLSFKI